MNAANSLPQSVTQCLTARVDALVSRPLDQDVLAKVKLCGLDHLAAVLSATSQPIARTGQALADAFGQGTHTLIATYQQSGLLGAIFYNALIATAEDLDDAHRYASGLHMSATTFPVLFGLAEQTPLSGQLFAHAVVAGYEVSSSVVRATDQGLRERGYHSTGAAGMFGACAAACAALGLHGEVMVNALGIAASAAGGLFAFLHEGASVRHAHGAWACTKGLESALLAQAGMTGPVHALEGYGEHGKDGYLRACADTWDESFLTSTPGKPEIMNTYHKIHAACGHAAPAITGLQALRDQLTALAPIASIAIKGYKASAALNNPHPNSVAEAKFSLPMLTGIVLVHGQATSREMVEATLHDPEVLRLASLVRVTEDPALSRDFPRLRACEISITLTDGQVLHQRVDAPLGMPENPVSMAVIEAKFRAAASGIFSLARQDEIIDHINRLETLPSVAPLVRLLQRF